MGGMWSGRNDYATTPTVAECKTIGVDWMYREGCLDVGASGSLKWSRGDERTGSMSYKTVSPAEKLDDATAAERVVVFSYHFETGETDDRDEHEYAVPIETTPCNFGGERPWFRCPGVVDGEECNRRVGKLHRPPRGDLYLCRHCYDLGYQSSRESGDDMKKALRRFQRAQEKLGVGPTTPESGGYDDLYPDRPKGMHRSTYEELMNELDDAREEWHAEFRAELDAMHAHTQSALADLPD